MKMTEITEDLELFTLIYVVLNFYKK